MKMPAPLALAHKIAPLLQGLDWAIGGSTLLHHLGLEAAPHDLDIVVTAAHFHLAEQRLLAMLEPQAQPAHPRNQSEHFARLQADDGTLLDLMAGIAVVDGSTLQRWNFQPQRVQQAGALRWMLAEDWIELYAWYQRPYRVAQLQNYLTAHDARRHGEELEIRTAFLDDTVEALSQTLARQQQELDLLQEQLRLLYRQSQRASDDGSGGHSLRDEIPPHY